jgi:HD superfamily phosphohydrolase
MHLGGRMLLAGLANVWPGHVSTIRSMLGSLVDKALRSGQTTRVHVIDYLNVLNDPLYQRCTLCSTTIDNADLDVIILFQAVRIACVMHDLGHFPLSHTLEEVIFDCYTENHRRRESEARRQFLKAMDSIVSPTQRSNIRPGELHEYIGRTLTDYILRTAPETNKGFARACFSLAESIATGKGPSHLVAIHGLMSGVLDADRLDYVRRDGYASGFEFGDFDLERILSTVRFRIGRRGRLQLRPTTVAASALESFFLERYRIYEWLVFHPMVVRINLAVQRALRILLEIYFDEEAGDEYEPVRKILKEGSGLSRLWSPLVKEEVYEQFAACDEAWLLTLLRDVQAALRGVTAGKLKRVALKVYLDLVCDRRKEQLRPLWKRQAEYAVFARIVAKYAKSVRRLPGIKEANDKVAVTNRLIEEVVGREISRVGKFAAMRRLEDDVQRVLVGIWDGGIVIDWPGHAFSPYDSTEILDVATGKALPLERLSTLVAGLSGMWDHEVRLRVFWWSRKQENGNCELIQAGSRLRVPTFAKAFAKVLIRWRKKQGSPRVDLGARQKQRGRHPHSAGHYRRYRREPDPAVLRP